MQRVHRRAAVSVRNVAQGAGNDRGGVGGTPVRLLVVLLPLADSAPAPRVHRVHAGKNRPTGRSIFHVGMHADGHVHKPVGVSGNGHVPIQAMEGAGSEVYLVRGRHTDILQARGGQEDSGFVEADLEDHGLLRNPSKSYSEPRQRLTGLGTDIWLDKMLFRVPESKKETIVAECKALLMEAESGELVQVLSLIHI